MHGNRATGSDHEIIEWQVNLLKQGVAGGTQVVGWNLAAMLPQGKEHAEKLQRERARGRALMGVESTGDNVESEDDWCQEALGRVLNIAAQLITTCTPSTRWWNDEINKRSSELGK